MIAIIGFSARSAGATNADEFWQVIRAAVPQFGPAPFDRWRPESVLSAEPRAAWSGYTNQMAAMEDPYGWDRAAFGIPVARARETFARARYTDQVIGGRGIGTVLGVASNDYRLLSAAPITARMLVDGSLGVEDAPSREALGRAISPTVIPALSIIEQMAEHRAPLHVFAPTSGAALSYEQLWADVRPS